MTAENTVDFKTFANDLAEYSCSWVPECQNKIIKHARELFEDKTMRDLLHKYAELKKKSERIAKDEFVNACIGEDTTEISDYEINNMKAKSYREVLDDLIWRAYCYRP